VPHVSLGGIKNVDFKKKFNRETKRNKYYNSKTNLWTNTRPLNIDSLTRSISVYVPKNINYLNILLLIGIGFSLYAPILFYSLTGVNIYDNSSITESGHSAVLFNIRICCATVF